MPVITSRGVLTDEVRPYAIQVHKGREWGFIRSMGYDELDRYDDPDDPFRCWLAYPRDEPDSESSDNDPRTRS